MKKVDGGGKRLNKGKIPIDMVPTSLIYAVARVFEEGAKKYEKDNWRRGMSHSKVYGCAMRHMLKWFEGQDKDKETGLSHLWHVATNIAMLIEYEKTCPELDDRYKGAQAVYEEFTEKVENNKKK